MIRSHFGLQRNPFDRDAIALLPRQQEVFDILQVHAQQGGLCLVLGEPGTGKSVLKQTLIDHDPKRLITPVVNRTFNASILQLSDHFLLLPIHTTICVQIRKSR